MAFDICHTVVYIDCDRFELAYSPELSNESEFDSSQHLGRFITEISQEPRNNMRITVLHGNALEEAEALAERICTEFNPIEVIINMTGPVLGINTGPRALALCGYTEA